jgi:hypothetical protein
MECIYCNGAAEWDDKKQKYVCRDCPKAFDQGELRKHLKDIADAKKDQY